MESQKTFTFRVPIEFDEDTRINIAEDVIEFIKRRTERGLDKNNKPFPKYSDSYSESLDFKIAGKTKNHVDLELSGDMMSSIIIINTGISGFITIGFESGSDENDKAVWVSNNLRSYFPKRDFLGIVDSDLNKILEKYRVIFESESRLERKTRNKIQEEAKRIISNFVFNKQ